MLIFTPSQRLQFYWWDDSYVKWERWKVNIKSSNKTTHKYKCDCSFCQFALKCKERKTHETYLILLTLLWAVCIYASALVPDETTCLHGQDIYLSIYIWGTAKKLPGVHSTTVQHEITHVNVNLIYFYYRFTQIVIWSSGKIVSIIVVFFSKIGCSLINK